MDLATAEWCVRVNEGCGAIASNIPHAAFQYQLGDSITQQAVRSCIDAKTASALNADATARASAIEKAATRFFGGQPPPDKLLKLLTQVTLCLRATKLPSLADVAKAQSTVDTFGKTSKGVGMGFGQAAALLLSVHRAAWPEFDWQPFDQLVDAVRIITDVATNESQAAPTRDAALRLCAKTWGMALKRMEKAADGARLALFLPADLRSIPILGAGAEDWIEAELSNFNDNLGLFAALASSNSGGGGGGGGVGAGGASGVGAGGVGGVGPQLQATAAGNLNFAMKPWMAEFPGVCLFAHVSDRGCNRGDSCPHAASHTATLDAEKVKAFKAKHGF